MDNWEAQDSLEPIAFIGMAGRFPGAKNVDEFWQNLKDGLESIATFSDEELAASGIDRALLNEPSYVKAGAILEDIDLFDASFFKLTAKEAAAMSPQHRLFLECAAEALEIAGYNTEAHNGRIAVYAGAGENTYFLRNLASNHDLLKYLDSLQIAVGNNPEFMPTQVSYKLNLTGPSVSINTACSTSLVAVQMACQSLLNYQCDLALAGGVSIRVPQKEGYLSQGGGMTSPDGHCRAFDARARGTLFGSGLGIVVLKRLSEAIADGDCIHALIRGAAINNDGANKAGYTAPSVECQAAVIAEAIALAGIEPETITYIEAHGTGTALGDPIEIAALTQAFRLGTQKKNFCALGSVKTNVGHLNTAAGIAGLIKTVLALKHKMLPPSLHFEQPNPEINFANSPFYVNSILTEWKAIGTPRRAGVSSFGIGGTNAHAVLEEAPPLPPSGTTRPWQLMLLSAKTSSALDRMTDNLAEHLKQNPSINLADVAYTLKVGRKAFNYRRMLVCPTLEAAVKMLSSASPQVLTNVQKSRQRPVVFMFSGLGDQYVNMGRDLYQVESTFRDQVDRCSDFLKPLLNLDLRHLLYPTVEEAEAAVQQLQQTAVAQPALFVIEYALAQLWQSWGLRPQAMIGHSIGEYVAACLAGVFSLEDALALVAVRGQLMQQLTPGAMLAVPLSEQEVQPLLGKGLSLAVVNDPSHCVVSGRADAVEALKNQLAERGVHCLPLHTSHAFDSEMMEPLLGPFTERVKQVSLSAPQIPYLSNVTGSWITADQATDSNYWALHLLSCVRLGEGLQQVLKDPETILLEVGPGRTLSTLALGHPDSSAEQVVLTSLRHLQDIQSDVEFLLTTTGKLWLTGVEVDWSRFSAHEHRHRLPLPTYPFERQRYWIDPKNEGTPTTSTTISRKTPKIARAFFPHLEMLSAE
jgi:acyl transferase domain-containing protein